MMAFLFAAVAMLALSLLFIVPPLLRGRADIPLRRHAVLLGAGAPLLAGLLYAALGTPAGLVATPAMPPIEAMVQRLADRLKTQPDDAEGWRRLARSYETLRRFDEAAEAYRQLLRLEPENLDAAVDYSVVLGMSLDGKLQGEPERILTGVLAREPNHLQALALAGSAALERGDKEGAVALWKRILAAAPADSPMLATIRQSIERAQASE